MYVEMQDDRAAKADLAMSLGVTLGSLYVFSQKALGFHWNVKGPDFVQFHDLFANIYDSAEDGIDPTAENILKLGYNAPSSFSEFLSLSEVQDGYEGSDDPVQMSGALLAANEILIAQINESIAIATAANEQGVIDDLSAMDAMQKKWSWQLRAITGMQNGGNLGKADADHSPVTMMSPEAITEVIVSDRPTQNCPYCSNTECMCDSTTCSCESHCTCGCRGLMAAASRRAPKKDRIYGSKKNPKGSASGGKKITFSAKTEKALHNKVKEHNAKAPNGRKATMAQLKAVYRRGAGAFSSSHRPGKTRDQWAMARVNAYLRLLKSGRPANPNYKQDNDVLPSGHPRSTRTATSIMASGFLDVDIKNETDYVTPEDAILAFAEFSDQGYEIIPALRTAWLRAVEANENPFNRARELAVSLYDSEDSDLLPKRRDDRG